MQFFVLRVLDELFSPNILDGVLDNINMCSGKHSFGEVHFAVTIMPSQNCVWWVNSEVVDSA